jgi:catechol 2,3-dioxygenase-like lactoylglutathione lyase family enzyme
MKLETGHLEFFVKDPIKSKDFYIDILGFDLEVIQHEKFVWLNKDNITILLRPGKPSIPAENYHSANIALVIYTDDLEKCVEELKSKGLEFKGIDGSSRCLTFTDYDGNWFQLVNPKEH